jgi:membrane fusion protein
MSQETTLFRKEAIEGASARLGPVARPVTVTSSALTLFMAVVLLSAIVFASTVQYARKESVTGILEPTQGVLRLLAPKPGVVETVLVAEGAEVKAGTPLFVINQDVVTGAGAPLAELLDKATNAQARALHDEAAARRQATAGEHMELLAKRQGLAAHLGALTGDLDLQAERVRLQEQSVASYQGLNQRKIVSDVQFRAQEDSLLQARQALSTIRKDQSDTISAISQVDGEVSKLAGDLRESEAQVTGSVAQVAEKQAANSGSKEIVIIAPKAGRVVAIQARPGAPVSGTAALAVILPQGAKLNAELWAPSRAAGFIRVGDPVRLMLDAFPYQKFGVVVGRVSEIAKAPTPPEELTTPIETKEALYRIDVGLVDQTIRGYGKAWPFSPGMRLNADVVLERRSLIEWLLDPLFAGMRRTKA